MANFKIATKPLQNGILLIKISGHIDAHTFEELENEVQEQFSNQNFKFIMDLSSVEYISSAGAGVFIGALSQAQENDGNVVLLAPPDKVLEVLELLGLHEFFTISKDLKSAAECF